MPHENRSENLYFAVTFKTSARLKLKSNDMKKILYSILFAALPALAVAQTRKEIPVGDFHAIESSGIMTIQLDKSDEPGVTVLSSDGKTDAIGAEVINGKLVLTQQGPGDVVVIVSYTALDMISTTGTNVVTINDSLVADKLTIEQGGASTISGKVVTSQLRIDASGSSDVNLSGRTNSLDLTASGASSVYLPELYANDLSVHASSAADVFVRGTQKLTVDAEGAADVQYIGEPIEKNVETTGAATVRKISDTPVEPRIDDIDAGKQKKKFQNDWKDRIEGLGDKKRYSQDLVWMGVDLGVNGYVDKDFNFQPQGPYDFMELNYGRNANVRLNFFEWRFNLAKNIFNLVTGMGFEWYHYSFDRNIRLHEAIDFPGQTFPTPIIGVQDTNHSISRSRLVVQSFCIPILFNLRSRKTDRHKQQFNFSFGVVGSVRIGSNNRVTYSEEGSNVREKTYDDFNLSMFAATAMVRIKYSFFSMYVSYTFTPMFQNDDPGLRPISLGVTLLSF